MSLDELLTKQTNRLYQKLSSFYQKLKEELTYFSISFGIASVGGAYATWKSYVDLKIHPKVSNLKLYEILFYLNHMGAWIYSKLGFLGTFLLYTIPGTILLYLLIKAYER